MTTSSRDDPDFGETGAAGAAGATRADGPAGIDAPAASAAAPETARAAEPAPAKPEASPSAATGEPGWERAVLEKLAFASLNEQRAARRWKIANRMMFLLFFLLLIWLLFRPSHPGSAVPLKHTAVVSIRGEIASGSDASAELVLSAAREAFENSGAQAVVLLINSPGGSPVQAGIINDEIKRLKAVHQKPVYAVVEEACASAAYYIAVSADRIIVDKASIVGSIGVLMDGFGFTGLMDKIGIERRLLTAGENKGFLDPFSQQTAPQRAHAQAMLDQIHRQFIGVVKAGRGARLKETPETFSGLFWTGEQAVQMGLADQLGNLGTVARELVQAEAVVDYTRTPNVAERLAKRFGAAVGAGAVRSLQLQPALR
jgi:protease-4